MRRFWLLSLLLSALFLLCAPAVVDLRVEPVGLTRGGERWVQTTLETMTLDEKIGQMIFPADSWGYEPDSSRITREYLQYVTEVGVGGLCLYPDFPLECAQSLNRLQAAAKYPLLVCADLEAGLGLWASGATRLPPLMGLGAINDSRIAYQAGKITAQEARAVGIHLAFSPVVDVNNNPDNPIINIRAFGGESDIVSKLAVAYIRGCQENGLLTTAKHFPGHGDTDIDSHIEMPVLDVSMERLESVELPPYKAVMDSAAVAAVMSAHIWVQAADSIPGRPATLSPPVMDGILRRKLGFKGLIFTDSMRMGGIVNNYSTTDAVLQSVQAGCDVVLHPVDPIETKKVLLEAVNSGLISEARIDQSVKRILEAKAKAGLYRGKLVDLNAVSGVVGQPERLTAAREMTERSLTLVKNREGSLPIEADPGGKVIKMVISDLDFPGREEVSFYRDLNRRIRTGTGHLISGRTSETEYQSIVRQALDADLLVIALFIEVMARKGSLSGPPRLATFFSELRRATTGRIVLLAMGNPYMITQFPEVDAYLCSYTSGLHAHGPVLDCLTGEISPGGRLPVKLMDAFQIGHGLTY
jgi:beta-glucosidase-like glycosyl hydrolase